MTQFVTVPDGLTVEFQYDRPHEEVDVPIKFGADFGQKPEIWMVTTAIACRRKRVLPRGGETRAIVKDIESGRVVGVGIAYCRPDEQFVKAIGRDLALERALLGCGSFRSYDLHVKARAEREQERLEAADRVAEANRRLGRARRARDFLGMPSLVLEDEDPGLPDVPFR